MTWSASTNTNGISPLKTHPPSAGNPTSTADDACHLFPALPHFGQDESYLLGIFGFLGKGTLDRFFAFPIVIVALLK